MPDRVHVEIRSAGLNGNTLTGKAHVFGNTAVVMGGRYERFEPQAFNAVLNDPNTDVRAFFNHDQSMLLGRQSSGTLRLEVEPDGLAFSVDLPETTYANDLRELVKRGDLDGASFAFIPGEVKFGRAPDGKEVRTHTSVKSLIDISPVPLPAFSGTSVQLRSQDISSEESVRSQTARARARVLRGEI